MTKISTETTRKMAAELIRGGMHPSEATERANNIAQAAMMTDIDCMNVAQMIAPVSGFRIGIADPLERSRAATQCLAQFIGGTTLDYWGKWAGLLMWTRMSPAVASEWLREHGHTPDSRGHVKRAATRLYSVQ